jgi:hypothetical protein
MIKRIYLILLFFPGMAFAQIFPGVPDYTGRILEIKEIGYHSVLKRNGWINLISFSDLALPVRELNFYKGKKRSDYHYFYVDEDSVFRKIKIDSMAGSDRNYEELRICYNQAHEIIKTKRYSDKAAKNPDLVEQEIRCDSLSRLLSYKSVLPSASRNEAGDLITQYKFHYNNCHQVDSVLRTDSENISKILYCYAYNKRGLISDEIVDHLDPGTVLGGVKPWSEKRMNMYHYRYKYDRKGNWTKRYFVTRKGKFLDAKRKIKYL